MNGTRALSATLTAVFVMAMVLASPSPSGAVVSGANGRIVFVSDRDGDKEIYAVRSDGSGLVQLTNNTANDWDPAVSADGTKVAFVTDRDGKPELYTMNIDGSSQTRITNNTYTESHPSWSPLGTQLVWASLNGSDSDIWKANANGSGAVDLTPDPVAFDADPSWSPGGISIAFDSTNRAGNTGTDVYTMKLDGTQVTRLTTTGKDSNPNWAPDNKNLAFESARDNGTPGAVLFANMSKQPTGVAVTSTRVLVAQFNSDKVQQLDSNGVPSNFATLPTTGLSVERYIAISPGLAGFPKDDAYVTVGQNVYQITPDGLTVTLCVNIPSMPNGETGITFDTVGTFQNQMILTDRTGPVWAVDSCDSSHAHEIGDVGQQIEGPLVAPLSFVPYGGQLLLGNEFLNNVYAMDSSGNVSTVITAESPEGLVLIPPAVCNMGTSGGAYFVAMKDMKQIYKFDATNFTGLNNDVLAPSELVTDINRLDSDGSSITMTQFSGPIGTPDLEGSAFAPCGTGAPRQAHQALVAGPHEIYKINVTSLLQTRLTNNSTDDASPAFSPDGATIVFQSDRDNPGSGKYDVYTMKASDGSSQTNITLNSANDITPDWETVCAVVSVSDFLFNPATSRPKQGCAVLWDFSGPSDHTATDSTGMGLFDSGTRSTGQFYVFKFVAAGSYPYFCTIHPTMTGTIKVPVTAAPTTGNLTTIFTITWASAAPPSGYKFDVQIFRPGATDWADWKPNTTRRSSTFVADSGTGVYSFQARLRNANPGNGFASDYSAAVSITVNP
jgi:Tol biopolymer transport system component